MKAKNGGNDKHQGMDRNDIRCVYEIVTTDDHASQLLEENGT